ncbi:MAG: hypothetical protein AB4352_02895 [Hormoscilla sp.]
MQLQNKPELDPETLKLALEDIQRLTEQQKQLRQDLTSKRNILFVTNSALLTFIAISKLITVLSLFSLGEILGLAVNFTLLLRAFLPRQVSVSPNLNTKEFWEYSLMQYPDEYQFEMLYNLKGIYNNNQQRLDDISQTISRSAYVTGVIALVVLLHLLASYLIPELKQP